MVRQTRCSSKGGPIGSQPLRDGPKAIGADNNEGEGQEDADGSGMLKQ
jgi:hypothetical protein